MKPVLSGDTYLRPNKVHATEVIPLRHGLRLCLPSPLFLLLKGPLPSPSPSPNRLDACTSSPETILGLTDFLFLSQLFLSQFKAGNSLSSVHA